MDNKRLAFDFGENWTEFSENSLDNSGITVAINDFNKLFEDIDLDGKSFLDIGFGQGLTLLIAHSLKMKTVGCDINPKSIDVLEKNKVFFKKGNHIDIPTVIGSILDSDIQNKIKQEHDFFDIVHSWGVLHHTGEMWNAIDISLGLISEKGYFIVAIYNKHWSSSLWKVIKYFYNLSPEFIRKIMIWFFYIVIILAKFAVTRKNPLCSRRGMNFYYNVVDWVGGYPYEYASKEEIVAFIKEKGFQLINYRHADVPTGCNEYVFKKVGKS